MHRTYRIQKEAVQPRESYLQKGECYSGIGRQVVRKREIYIPSIWQAGPSCPPVQSKWYSKNEVASQSQRLIWQEIYTSSHIWPLISHEQVQQVPFQRTQAGPILYIVYAYR